MIAVNIDVFQSIINQSLLGERDFLNVTADQGAATHVTTNGCGIFIIDFLKSWRKSCKNVILNVEK